MFLRATCVHPIVALTDTKN